MKKTIFFTMIMMLIAMQVKAHDFEAVNNDGVTIYFKLVSGKAVVTYRGSSYDAYSDEYSGIVNIPPSVLYGSTVYFISTIGENAFRGCKGLKGVTIPAVITTVENHAFRGCTGLTSVNIINGANNVYLRGYVFLGCTSLENILLPASVVSMGGSVFSDCTNLKTATMYCSRIGDSAFDNCTELTSVTLGKYTTDLGYSVFNECTGLQKFIVDEENTSFSTIDDVLFSKDKTVLYCFPNMKTSSYVIPDGVTSVNNYAFRYCTNLASITIPNSLTSPLDRIFTGCTHLREFIVSEQNTAYAVIDGVLCNKDKTTLISYPNAKASSYTIPATITEIGKYAFGQCSNLTSIVIPNDISWGDNAFYYCSNLSNVTLGNNVKTIGDEAFAGCENLKSITIPAKVTVIGSWAFYGCGLKNIIIPDEVTTVGNAAFESCKDLTNVVIGKRVTDIGFYAFYNCINLIEIHSRNTTPPVVNDGAPFWYVDMSACKLYVPKGTSEAYKARKIWKDFVNIIEENISSINWAGNNVLSAYPNPATDQISISGLQIHETLDFYNINSRFLFSLKANNETETVAVDHLPAGMYLVKISTGRTLKWVKK